jgi:hypothetical protein
MARKTLTVVLPSLAYANNTVTSQWVAVDSFQSFGFQVVFSAAPTTCVLSLDYSFDPVATSQALNASGTPLQPTNSFTDTTNTYTASSKTIGVIDAHIGAGIVSANWVRVRIAATSGTGTASITLSAKALGA